MDFVIGDEWFFSIFKLKMGDSSKMNRVFVRSVMNFVIGDEWFFSIFKLNMGDSSKMV